VNECVGLAVIALDEAETLHRIEEFYRALGLLASQLALRAALGAFHRHRFALDPEVGGRNAAPAVDQGELERLPVGKIGEPGLLDC
jgi:hypothetical protein